MNQEKNRVVTFRVTEREGELLSAVAHATRVSKSEICRMGVNDFLLANNAIDLNRPQDWVENVTRRWMYENEKNAFSDYREPMDYGDVMKAELLRQKTLIEGQLQRLENASKDEVHRIWNWVESREEGEGNQTGDPEDLFR